MKISKSIGFIAILFILIMCNIALFFKGWSYVGYSVSVCFLVGLILFRGGLNDFNFILWSTAFIMAFTNILAELNYKFKWVDFADPTRVDDWSYFGIIYIITSFIIALLWSRKKKQQTDF